VSAVTAADRVGDALAAAIDALAAAGVESPRLDAELLLADASGVDRARLIADPDAGLEPGAGRAFGQMVRRRLHREPVAYILGRRWFRDLELLVDSRALIPRPETELLVEVGVELGASRVLDVGTGSGAVALALAAELPDAMVVATDNSPAALDLAGENAAQLGLAGRVRFEPGTLPDTGATFDLLLANLPYVAEPEWASLAPEIRDWEPREALLAGADGLEAIGKLLDQLWARDERRAPSGEGREQIAHAVALEVGAGQAARVEEMVADAGYARTEVRNDLAGIPRVVIGRTDAMREATRR
jgi:release factor glutamine methyltransferase